MNIVLIYLWRLGSIMHLKWWADIGQCHLCLVCMRYSLHMLSRCIMPGFQVVPSLWKSGQLQLVTAGYATEKSVIQKHIITFIACDLRKISMISIDLYSLDSGVLCIWLLLSQLTRPINYTKRLFRHKFESIFFKTLCDPLLQLM